MMENKWIPYPENTPVELKSISGMKQYIVTMQSEYAKFTTVATWARATVRGNVIHRWEYDHRIGFPWNVIAFMELPEPYQEKQNEES